MTGLYLTKTRRSLLQEVADGNVVRSHGTGCRLYDHYRAGYRNGIGTRLSARVAELERAGWIVLVSSSSAPGWTSETWCLTAAGDSVLLAGVS